MIPGDFIDELLHKTDIVDIIDELVPLKKGGQNYLACCPFHKEKTPSFTVSPTKQFYHCFSCGAHGSAIGFLMEHQGLSFVEAVQKLADRVGMVVPKVAGGPAPEQVAARKQKQLALEDVTERAAEFYRQQLKQDQRAIDYLKRRGLSGQVAAHYGLGYAPEAWQGLADAFDVYPSAVLVEAGMVIEKEGKHYDRFRDRIMFPIRNQRGAVIGFGGRVLDKGEPKYLNSPETPLFDKGRELYGLFEAKAAIKAAERILVVEGYMDVVALAQFEVGYAVASLGTATSAEHIKLLMRHSNSIYFCFDGDAAGRKAAWRALENALPMLQDDKSLHFLFLPADHDPDSYIRAHGRAQFEQTLLEDSLPLSVYFFRHLSQDVALDRQEGKAELIKRSTPLLAEIKAPALNYLLTQQLAQMVGVEVGDLGRLLGQTQATATPKSKHKQYRLPAQSFRQPQMDTLVARQIKALLINPHWAAYTSVPEYWAAEGDFACLAYLLDMLKSAPRLPSGAQLLEQIRGSEHEARLRQLLIQAHDSVYVGDAAEDESSFCDGMRRLFDEVRHNRISALSAKNQTEGLTEEEARLLVALLSRSSQASES